MHLGFSDCTMCLNQNYQKLQASYVVEFDEDFVHLI